MYEKISVKIYTRIVRSNLAINFKLYFIYWKFFCIIYYRKLQDDNAFIKSNDTLFGKNKKYKLFFNVQLFDNET